MKRWIPLAVLLLGAAYLGSTLRPPANRTEFDLRAFGQSPILANGRIKPLDTVARTSLLVLQGRQRFVAPDAKTLPPAEWLLDVLFNPTVADDYRHFLIENPELLSVFGKEQAEQKRFSFNELRPGLVELQRQMRLVEPVEDPLRTPFQKEVVKLYSRLVQYQQLKYSLSPEDGADLAADLRRFEQALPVALAAFRAREAGQPHDEAALKAIAPDVARFQFMSETAGLLAIPPAAGSMDATAWRKAGDVLLETVRTGRVDPVVLAYADLGRAWRLKQPADFNRLVRQIHEDVAARFPAQMRKSDIEARFNSTQPFYSGIYLYVLTFLLAVISWLKWPDTLRRAAFWLMALAFAATTAGIGARMWLEGRPPVTNLYSSALFVGWVAVLLCLILEALYRNAIASAAGGLIGFLTLLIAHHLSLGGDTLEMMRAVLDSNFWLATHVVVITMGYGSTFLAGFLALVYIGRGLFTRSLDKATADALTRMVYGIVCFATLFSLVGTVLGGIWADQSWGRFWGWDPKENGALIIVLWNAIILHCRWAGMVRARGLMMLAVFGNVVTAWSWFGVNMLGVGLHSYGFMDQAFWWLLAFFASQASIILLAAIPTEKWRSFRTAGT